MPAHSKDPSVRARRNKTATRATLKPVENPEIPDLPAGTKWHPQVRDWWTRAWSSPMVPEWTESDIDTMYLAAKLMQLFWKPGTTAGTCKALAGEIRQLLATCGLTPMARRSLQWEIERGEAAAQQTAARRAGEGPASSARSAGQKRTDPRAARALAAVK
ncbi:hypothetical protein EV580_1328 [Mycobacterium sp. BK086]|uniref:phage terminase small subunit n=1 Tax=Mycobacterium sp. BK086 TaxID=2512165 RepID=UPI00105FC917|nr:hypothetical protein [Mycobacterium sp. BK086]TDO18146.1 hypothetical protein EV580_1328 [Mycobacterium sp. BK086]